MLFSGRCYQEGKHTRSRPQKGTLSAVFSDSEALHP